MQSLNAYTCQMPLHAWRSAVKSVVHRTNTPESRYQKKTTMQVPALGWVRDFGLQQGNTARGRHAAISAKSFTAHLLELRFRLFCGEVTNGTPCLYIRTRTQHFLCATDVDLSLAGMRCLENTCNALIRSTDVRRTHGLS